MKSLKDCFDIVRHFHQNIPYANFKTWLEENQVLRGFNLTEKLIQQLFSYLDPHKKGHLTENDWEVAFGGYTSDELNITELRDFISASYNSPTDAWEYYMHYEANGYPKTYLDYNTFSRASLEMLQGRLNEEELKKIWNRLLPGEAAVMSKVKF